jgi:hypothetical protein
VRACLTAEQLRDIFDPAQQLGEAPALVDQVVADADRAIATGDAVSRSAGQRER